MNRAHVVVVNDDPIQLKQVAVILEKAGHEVSAFLDAADALAGLSGRLDVHLFVVDLHMPGIDGWKLCRLLRSPDFGRYNDTPILVVSATFTGADVTAITRELGANGFLEAPFDAASLRRHVDALLAGEVPRTEQVVLIAEDDDAVLQTLVRTFSAHGYEVLEARTVLEARAALAGNDVDLALLDYHMPDGTCEALLDAKRSATDRTSILVMTGDTDPALPVRLLAKGADAYVRKPFDPSFAMELARKAARQRALLRIESILEERTRELQASEERYRELFRTIPDLVLVVDPRWHVVQVNPEGLALLGVKESELLNRHLLELAHPEASHKLSRWITELEQEKGSGRMEVDLMRPDGDRISVEFTGRLIEWHAAPALLLVGVDLTDRRAAEAERRRMEVQMQHAQRLESLGVLAGGVAHDFNNLLVGILGNASLAMMDLSENSSVREPLQQIELAARRAAELTQQILAFAGKSKVASQELDLGELVQEMAQLLEPAISKKARLSFRLPRSLPTIRGDVGQLRQVVMNLIINASDALGSRSGDIVVTTRLVDLAEDARWVAVDGGRPEAGQWISLEVEDTGCGMDPETLARIFEPFFTTKFSGRGLGLASTLGIVRAHMGHISVASSPGAGTTVTVLLPPHGKPRGKGKGADEDIRDTGWEGSGTVLVVDDEPQVRRLARSVLERRGFKVIEATNGAEGVRMAFDTTPDAVVMDVSMPEMDGVEALAQLRTRCSWLPVLLSSGYPPEGVTDHDPRHPTAFLQKPYGPDELMDGLRRLLISAADLTPSQGD